MKRIRFTMLWVAGCLLADGCTFHVNSRDPVRDLEDGMLPPTVRGIVGVPDTVYGPAINVYNDTVEVWSYTNRPYREPCWVYMVNQQFFKSGAPRVWQEEIGKIASSHFRK